VSTLSDLLRGKHVHVDPIAAVEDLPWELAGRRVIHLPHTIWQQLGHQNFWMDFELKCIEGPEQRQPEHASDSWPKADGPADELAWHHELALLRTNLGQLHALAEAQASTLARVAHPKTGHTVEAVLWSLAAHNSYHTGQVVQLRQALGVWPPAGGGLTW
jgi:uncharacterized damage-inducible protein DinB